MKKLVKCGLIALFLSILTLVDPSFVSVANAQDPENDLSVSFSSKRERPEDAGYVLGKLTNKSSRAYPCVRIEFDLSTRFDKRQAGEKPRHLGVLATEVEDVQPRSVTSYKEDLPFPAGIRFKSVSVCRERPSTPEGETTPHQPLPPKKPLPPKGPPPPKKPLPPKTPAPPKEPSPPKAPPPSDTTPGTCSISGRLTGKWKQSIRERPQDPASIWVVPVLVLNHGSRKAVAQATVSGQGRYQARDLLAGKKYLVRPAWGSDPREAEVTCVRGRLHTAATFRITGRPLID